MEDLVDKSRQIQAQLDKVYPTGLARRAINKLRNNLTN
jgi:hypothetical protein